MSKPDYDAAFGRLDAASFVATILHRLLTTDFDAVADIEDHIERIDQTIQDRDLMDCTDKLRRLLRATARLRRRLARHRVVFSTLARPDFSPADEGDRRKHFAALDGKYEDVVEDSRDLAPEHFAKVPELASSILRFCYAAILRMPSTEAGSALSPQPVFGPITINEVNPMKRSLLALTLLAALPFAASAAEGVSYNYVQGGYVATNGDGDADGFGIDGSVAVHPNFHLFGGYNQQEVDNTNVDIDQWKLGVGYNYGINDKADLVTRVAYEKLDAGSGFDFDGYSAEVGVRGALGSKFEGYAMAGYEDYEQSDGDFYGRVGAQVKFNQSWGLSGDVKFADGDTQWFVGPRFSW